MTKTKKTRLKLSVCFFAITNILFLTGINAYAITEYTTTDLGTLIGSSYSRASDINDFGQVVGYSGVMSKGLYHAFLWEDGTMKNLGTLDGVSNSGASAINNSGQVVGYSGASSTLHHAVLWEDDKITDLGFLKGGSSYRSASDINNSGHVVGYSGGTAFLWKNEEEGMVEIDHPDNLWFYSHAINDSGQVVGRFCEPSYFRPNEYYAFLWEDGIMKNISSLEGGLYTSASDINNSGQIVGLFGGPNAYYAFLWEDDVIQNLGFLEGHNSSGASDINDFGQVVGVSRKSGGEASAFLWEDGTMYDLNDLLPSGSDWQLDVANAINNNGQIIGNGWINGQEHAFLMTPITQPIPEPTSMLLLGTGLLGLLGFKKKKKI